MKRRWSGSAGQSTTRWAADCRRSLDDLAPPVVMLSVGRHPDLASGFESSPTRPTRRCRFHNTSLCRAGSCRVLKEATTVSTKQGADWGVCPEPSVRDSRLIDDSAFIEQQNLII